MKKNKKGFTIVELVIVIAVIAILAAVLVPTFSGIVLKAQRSADTQVVRMLNEDMAIDLAQSDKNKHDTMYDAVQACVAMGVSPDKISAKSDYNIAWESSSGRFVLIDPATAKVMYPQNDNNYDIYDITGKEIDYFIVTTYDNRIEEDETFKYSVYAYGNDWPTELKIHSGFDVGNVKGFEKITYENNAEGKNLIIRTSSFLTKLEINGLDTDSVKHYGPSAVVNVNSVGSNAYYEFGTVGRLTVKKGLVVVEDYAEVFCLMEQPVSSGAVESSIVSTYANVHDDDIKTCNAHVGVVVECEDGEHNNSRYVADDKYIYEVCTLCGYTLKDNKAMEETTVYKTFVDSSNSHDGNHEHVFEKNESTKLLECSCGLSYVGTHKVTVKIGDFVGDGSPTAMNVIRVYHVKAEDVDKLYKDKDGNYYCDYDFLLGKTKPHASSEADYNALSGGVFFSSASTVFTDIRLNRSKNTSYTYEVGEGDLIFIFELADNGANHFMKSLTVGSQKLEFVANSSNYTITSPFGELAYNNRYFNLGSNSSSKGLKLTVNNDVIIEIEKMMHIG